MKVYEKACRVGRAERGRPGCPADTRSAARRSATFDPPYGPSRTAFPFPDSFTGRTGRSGGALSIGFDARELLGELVQMASCFDPVRVQGESPLGGFDRLDEGVLDEVIILGSRRFS